MSSLQLDSFNSLASFLAEAHRTLAEEQQYCSSLSALVTEAEQEQELRQSKIAELHASIEQLRQRCDQLRPTKTGLESSVGGAQSSSERAEQFLQQQGQDLEELRARLQDTTEGLMAKKRLAEARFPAHCIAAAAELRRVHQERQRLMQLRHVSLQEGRRRREEAWLLLRDRLVALAAAVVRVRPVDHGPRSTVWQQGHGRMLALTAMDTSPGTTSIQHPGMPNSTIPSVCTSKYFNKQPSSRRKNFHVSFKLQEEPRRHTTNSAAWMVQGENDGSQDQSDMEVDLSSASPVTATSLEYSQLNHRRTSTPSRTSCVSASFFQKDPCQSTLAANDSGFSEVTQSRTASRHPLLHRRQSEEDCPLENNSTRSSNQFSTVSFAVNSPSPTVIASDSWKKGAEPSDGAGRLRRSKPDTPAQPRSRSLSRLTLPGLKFRLCSSRTQSAERSSPSSETTGGGAPAEAVVGDEEHGGGVEELKSGSTFSSILPHRSEVRGRAGVGQSSLQPAGDNPRLEIATTSSPVLTSTTSSATSTTPPSTVRTSDASCSLSFPLASSSPSLASLASSSSPQTPFSALSSISSGTSTVSSSPYLSGLLASGRSTNWRNTLNPSKPFSTAGKSSSYMFSMLSSATSVSKRSTAGNNTICLRNSLKQTEAAGSFPTNSISDGSLYQSDEVATAAPPSAAKDYIEGTKRTGVEEVADCVVYSTGQEKRSLVEMEEDGMMDVTEQEIQRLEDSYKSFLQQGSPVRQVEDDSAVAMEEASVSSSIGVEASKDPRKKDIASDTPSDSSSSKAAAQHTKKHAFSFKRISETLTSTVSTVAHSSSSTVTTHSNTAISTAIAPTTSFTSTLTASFSQVNRPGATPSIPLSTSSSSAVLLNTQEMLAQASPHAVAVSKEPSSNAPSISSTSSFVISRSPMLKFTTAASSSTSAILPASSYVGCVSSSQAVSPARLFPSPSALSASSEPMIDRSIPRLQPAACSTSQSSSHILPSAFPKPPCPPLLPAFVSPRTTSLTFACPSITPQTFTSPRSTPQTYAPLQPANQNFASPRPAPQLPSSQKPRRPSPSPPSPRISIGNFHMTSPRPPLPVTTQTIHQLSPRPSRSPSPRDPLSSLPQADSSSQMNTSSFDYSAPRNVTTSLPSFGPASSADGADPSAQKGIISFSQTPSVMSAIVSPSGPTGEVHIKPTMMMSPLLPGRGSPASMMGTVGSAFPGGQHGQQPRDYLMYSPLFGALAGGRSEANSPAGDSGFLLAGVPSQQQQSFSLFGSPLLRNGASSPGAASSLSFSLFGDNASKTSLDQASSSQGATPGTGGFFSFGGGDDSGGGGGGSFFSSLFGGGNDGGEEEDATDSAAAFRIF